MRIVAAILAFVASLTALAVAFAIWRLPETGMLYYVVGQDFRSFGAASALLFAIGVNPLTWLALKAVAKPGVVFAGLTVLAAIAGGLCLNTGFGRYFVAERLASPSLFEAASDAGSPNGRYQVATTMLTNGERKAEAVDLLESASSGGDVRATALLTLLYSGVRYESQNVEPNLEKARGYFCRLPGKARLSYLIDASWLDAIDAESEKHGWVDGSRPMGRERLCD